MNVVLGPETNVLWPDSWRAKGWDWPSGWWLKTVLRSSFDLCTCLEMKAHFLTMNLGDEGYRHSERRTGFQVNSFSVATATFLAQLPSASKWFPRTQTFSISSSPHRKQRTSPGPSWASAWTHLRASHQESGCRMTQRIFRRHFACFVPGQNKIKSLSCFWILAQGDSRYLLSLATLMRQQVSTAASSETSQVNGFAP